MCMSFTDATQDRQEEIIATVAGYARNDDSDFWSYKLPHYTREMAAVYAGQDTADLVAHRAHLAQTHRADPDWAIVAGLIDAELAAREALAAEAETLAGQTHPATV